MYGADEDDASSWEAFSGGKDAAQIAAQGAAEAGAGTGAGAGAGSRGAPADPVAVPDPLADPVAGRSGVPVRVADAYVLGPAAPVVSARAVTAAVAAAVLALVVAVALPGLQHRVGESLRAAGSTSVPARTAPEPTAPAPPAGDISTAPSPRGASTAPPVTTTGLAAARLAAAALGFAPSDCAGEVVLDCSRTTTGDATVHAVCAAQDRTCTWTGPRGRSLTFAF